MHVAERAGTLLAHSAPAPLEGTLRPPGDKSISHRALIFASLADGVSRIEGLLQARDVEATASACRQLGAEISTANAHIEVRGAGGEGLSPPAGPLDMGNSGTAMRLLAGVLAAQPFDSVLIGDASLSRRPMRRIAEPLREMGAVLRLQENGCAPIEIDGGHRLEGIRYRSPVASAQVKSCVLLAGLYASGTTEVVEPARSRDHTERMLQSFGAGMPGPVAVRGGTRLHATDVRVPADISSAAFFLVAAALVPGSRIFLEDVGLNPSRAGLIDAMQAMGCDLRVDNRREFGAEPVGDVEARFRPGIRGIDLPARAIPSMIDELPVLSVLAAISDGITRIRGAQELRVKESDRIAVMAAGLQALGFEVREQADGMDIHGHAQNDIEGGNGEPIEVDAAGDHRCAMSFAVLAQALGRPVRIRGAAQIDTSYPGFADHLAELGGVVEIDKEAAHA